MGHVDHAHQTEGDGQPERGNQENRSQTEAVKNRSEEVHDREITIGWIGVALVAAFLTSEAALLLSVKAAKGVKRADAVQFG